MAVMDIIIQAQDKASEVLSKVGDTGVKAGKRMEYSWKQVALAGAALGGSIEVMARKQAPLTEATRKLAAATGMTEGEMRKLAIETANVTRPLEDVFDLFEIGRQQGMKTADELKNFAAIWDTVADATGENSVELAKLSVGLRAVGIDSSNQGDAMSALGFILENTTFGTKEFLDFVKLTGPELNAMSMDIDDTAAIMGVLENELGLTGRRLRSEFKDAVRGADGDLNKMYASLGITAEQVDRYRQKVGESSDVIQRNADIHALSYTAMQRMQHAVGELAFRYGGLFEKAAQLAPALIAIGPAIKGFALIKKGLAVATGAVTTALKAFTLAKLAAIAPIVLVVAAVAGLIAIFVHLFRTNEEFREKVLRVWAHIKETGVFVFETLKEVIQIVMERIWSVIQTVLTLVQDFWEQWGSTILAFVTTVFNQILATIEFVMTLIQGIVAMISALIQRDWESFWAAVEAMTTAGANFVRDTVDRIFSGMRDRALQIWTSMKDGIKGTLNAIIDQMNRFVNAMNRISFSIPDWVPVIGGRSWGFRLPNIPRLHSGGIFRSPVPGGEGLALLRDREKVVTPGSQGYGSGGGTTINNYFLIEEIRVQGDWEDIERQLVRRGAVIL